MDPLPLFTFWAIDYTRLSLLKSDRGGKGVVWSYHIYERNQVKYGIYLFFSFHVFPMIRGAPGRALAGRLAP